MILTKNMSQYLPSAVEPFFKTRVTLPKFRNQVNMAPHK